jgi:hypothetical protein
MQSLQGLQEGPKSLCGAQANGEVSKGYCILALLEGSSEGLRKDRKDKKAKAKAKEAEAKAKETKA